jgi:hypothetical protein
LPTAIVASWAKSLPLRQNQLNPQPDKTGGSRLLAPVTLSARQHLSAPRHRKVTTSANFINAEHTIQLTFCLLRRQQIAQTVDDNGY